MKSIDAGRFAVGWQGLSRELGGLSNLPNRRDLVFLRFERPPTKRIPVSKIKNWLPCFLAMALTPAPAMADQVVGNLSSFVQGAPSFGDQYLGVVIDAPSSTSLKSFQWLNLESGWYSSQYNSTPSINFGASLYRWDPVANQTVGSAIWAQSGLTLSLPPGPSDLYP
ncbi:MAG: hypothetical protein KGO47_06310, partial [Cyanobacteria bacterium REEB417]|nr:hypothetical protein [Cyanobacteria bacterium REEB417]